MLMVLCLKTLSGRGQIVYNNQFCHVNVDDFGKDMIENKHYWSTIEEQTAPCQAKDRAEEKKELSRYGVEDDKLKKKVSAITWKFRGLIAGCLIFVVCGVILVTYGGVLGGLLGGGIGFVICVVAAFLVNWRCQKLIKYSLVRTAVTRYFSPEIYLAYKRVPEAIIEETDVVGDFDFAWVSDYFAGTWRDVKFQFGDLTIRGRREKSPVRSKLFTGQLFVIETGLNLETPLTIHERVEPISSELYEGRKNSNRFFQTGNEAFDRQFEVRLGTRSVNGGPSEDSVKRSNLNKAAHDIVDVIAQDIVDADAFAVSHTVMRFVGNRLYLTIENKRDTFELVDGDLRHLDILAHRFDEEVQGMTMYLDLVMTCLDKIKKGA